MARRIIMQNCLLNVAPFAANINTSKRADHGATMGAQMASAGYNGYKNWNQWNVSLWINNDEGLYRMAVDAVKACKGNIAVAARRIQRYVGGPDARTPDGGRYSLAAIRAAISDIA